MVEVKNPCLATCKIVLIVGLLTYAATYQILFQRGYQLREEGVGSVTPRVIGTMRTKEGEVWDAPRLVVPIPHPGSIFITTNFLVTRGQVQGECPGSAVDKYDRTRSEACPCDEPGKSTVHGVQVSPGECVGGFCLLHAWCPVEKEELDKDGVLDGVQDFRIMLRASTSFPEFGYSTNNMGKARAAKGENMFYVRDLLEMANTTFKDIAAEGGIIVVTVDWDCDLDREAVWGKDPCTHTFSARRLDRKSAIVRGYSFRNANYYYQNETVLTRDLERRAGIQFIFAVYSVAGRFDLATLSVNVGAALGLLTLATFAVDFALMYYPWRSTDTLEAARNKYQDEEEWLLGGADAPSAGPRDQEARAGAPLSAGDQDRSLSGTEGGGLP